MACGGAGLLPQIDLCRSGIHASSAHTKQLRYDACAKRFCAITALRELERADFGGSSVLEPISLMTAAFLLHQKKRFYRYRWKKSAAENLHVFRLFVRSILAGRFGPLFWTRKIKSERKYALFLFLRTVCLSMPKRMGHGCERPRLALQLFLALQGSSLASGALVVFMWLHTRQRS